MTTLNADARNVTASRTQRESLLPIFVKITGRPCLVVGAGHAALKKIEALLECGAQVHVVAKDAMDAIRTLAQQGALRLTVRHYIPEDLGGAFLVIAATNDPLVNQAIFRDAKAYGILINAVDAPSQCDFFFPAIVRRGSLQIAVSTSGESPAFAQRLKEDINSVLPQSLGGWLEAIGALRRTIIETFPAGSSRTKLLASLANRPIPVSPGTPVDGGAALLRPERRVLLNHARVAEEGTVYFINAGPGTPELLTLRAASLLATADVIVYDEAVPSAVLSMGDPKATLVSAVSQDSSSGGTVQGSSSHLISNAKAGHRIVRLSADSSDSFDTRSEEIMSLRAADVAFEVVLGISERYSLSINQRANMPESFAAP